MSDPHYNPDQPGYGRPIVETPERSRTGASAVLAVLAVLALVVIGVVFASQYRSDNKTAVNNSENNPAATTGSATPAAAAKPLPSGKPPTEPANPPAGQSR